MPLTAAIVTLGHRYTMYVDSRVGVPSRFHDPNGRVVATATLRMEWAGVVEIGAFQYAFMISDDRSSIHDRIGCRASATSLDVVTLIAGESRPARRFELAATGPDRYCLYHREHNFAVLNHARIGNRVDMVGESSLPGFVGLLATLIVAYVPPRYAWA
jgi:hypothetical protein